MKKKQKQNLQSLKQNLTPLAISAQKALKGGGGGFVIIDLLDDL